ncbi:sulfate ABC transporter substrate-binding protein [Cohnella sp. JJ-181]|uniref:sulfate ABC transporter substrate-binding protein n=1 Tax=Cohnella rhizoplanae TaxID=2974897 RepID=UPI00232AB8FF|nr:sulfate ABC transporter substrate-binding protein [Cohnella sp. JJ-181]
MAGCGGAPSANGPADGGGTASQESGTATLVVGAYSVAKDALQEILPSFAKAWEAKTGQKLRFQESYEASGTQARSIVGGFKADVAVLSLEGDMDKIVKAGLMSEDWKKTETGGMITRSVVVLGTREGNPLGIAGFADLARPGVRVLFPNPKVSGGAQWDINAIYGAGLKQSERESGQPDPAAAKAFLADVYKNVESMDKSGRASMAAFEYGVGDVIVTYENELLARVAQGVRYEIVTPDDTILIENPAGVVGVNADAHGVREAADALVSYMSGAEAQAVFAEHGFRPVSEEVAGRYEDRYRTPSGLFDIGYLGGWDRVRSELYGKRGVWYQVLAGK